MEDTLGDGAPVGKSPACECGKTWCWLSLHARRAPGNREWHRSCYKRQYTLAYGLDRCGQELRTAVIDLESSTFAVTAGEEQR